MKGGDLKLSQIAALMGSALTLAVLPIDTLKTCVVLDQMTHSQHNRIVERCQGIANVTSILSGRHSRCRTMGCNAGQFISGATARLRAG